MNKSLAAEGEEVERHIAVALERAARFDREAVIGADRDRRDRRDGPIASHLSEGFEGSDAFEAARDALEYACAEFGFATMAGRLRGLALRQQHVDVGEANDLHRIAAGLVHGEDRLPERRVRGLGEVAVRLQLRRRRLAKAKRRRLAGAGWRKREGESRAKK